MTSDFLLIPYRISTVTFLTTSYLGPGVNFTYFTGTIPTVSPKPEALLRAVKRKNESYQEELFQEHFHTLLLVFININI